ncbi:endolytic transglycosylase MltG [Candidatus Neomarinimicrobiota bacterium]
MRQRIDQITRAQWVAIGSLAVVLLLLTFRYILLSWAVPGAIRAKIVVPQGASAYQVGGLLEDAGIVKSKRHFVYALKVTGRSRKLTPGSFVLLNVRHLGDLIAQLIDRESHAVWITVPEGSTLDQVALFIAAKYPIDVEVFSHLTEDKELLTELGIKQKTLEGYLFPDTYLIPNGSNELGIIKRMVRQTQSVLDDEMLEVAKQFSFDAKSILTLASIIEGEARVGSERSLISAVYHNRLKKGMRLQADPTVQYAIPGKQRRLLFRDYKINSPYNTYRYKGLPPGPINNPGLASIRAALNPSDVDYLYFVATEDGSHIFSTTWEEHRAAIDRIRKN